MILDVGQGMRCAWRTLSSELGFTLIALMTPILPCRFWRVTRWRAGQRRLIR